ncbi:transcriptional regulator, TetR family [Kribbella flavida DSM 17836]|uniref:Transcriptional regulator, TetR family n=1 Tax=Kribbella flavida (strain DSM 17836 / JCM 10339 / NBRC 14399) TaxID=479435 RepID=D2PMT3_KRIFD|nr:TetR/AcrR family transcriptional regulator [Kribbella flavida]ADB32635.1 transcriptional regulator, TetR family [Kribbella flavida DSM 17836]
MSDLLWNRKPAPRRGPKPATTLTGIAEAAVAVADAEGLEAVSMQRVAGELGLTKMALYRYLPGKAELVAVMSDLAVGVPPERPASGWREALSNWTHDLYRAFERHPWLLQSTIGRRPIGPNELTWTDRGLTALAGTGLSGTEQLDMILVLSGHVRTTAQQTLTIPGVSTGVTEQDITAALVRAVTEQPERFPGLAAALRDPGDQHNAGFTFGLQRILDGLEVLIGRSAGRPRD